MAEVLTKNEDIDIGHLQQQMQQLEVVFLIFTTHN